ncbi:MAG: hypothetical protein ACUVTQ_08590 [Desulfotomaculales bacterium]
MVSVLNAQALAEELKSVFSEQQATVLAEVMVKAYRQSQEEAVKVGDFNELKEIVRNLSTAMGELAQAQARTEQKMEELAEAQRRTEQKMEELAEAQKRTEQRLEELAEAQRRTEQRVDSLTAKMEELTAAIASLTRVTESTKTELGGLSRSMGYALKNETYRHLPAYLEGLGVRVTEKFVRTEIEGEEINVFARGRKNGREAVIVGKAELRFSSPAKKLKQLERKVAAVRKKFPTEEIVCVLVTHYATPEAVAKAKEKGVIVVQSFQWV